VSVCALVRHIRAVKGEGIGACDAKECMGDRLVLSSCAFVRRRCRVGQNYIYTVYIQNLWLRNHQIYGADIQFWPILCI
jgi:hypothetical protein